jgi:hypothetical protein
MATVIKRLKRQRYRLKNKAKRKNKKNSTMGDFTLISPPQFDTGFTAGKIDVGNLLNGLVKGAIDGAKTGVINTVGSDPNVKQAVKQAAEKQATTNIAKWLQDNYPTMGWVAVGFAALWLGWKGIKYLIKRK